MTSDRFFLRLHGIREGARIESVIHRVTIYVLVVLFAADSVGRWLEFGGIAIQNVTVPADSLSDDSSLPAQVQAIEPAGFTIALKPIVCASQTEAHRYFRSPDAVSHSIPKLGFHSYATTLQSQFVRLQI